VDTQTRHALKNDKFAQATASSVSWVSGHRSGVVRVVIAAVVLLALVIGAIVFYNVRSSAADSALGGALDVYDARWLLPALPPKRASIPQPRTARAPPISSFCKRRSNTAASGRQKGALLCGHHLRGTGPDRFSRGGTEAGSRLLDSNLSSSTCSYSLQ